MFLQKTSEHEKFDSYLLKLILILTKNPTHLLLSKISCTCLHFFGLLFAFQGKYALLYENVNASEGVFKFIDAVAFCLMVLTNVYSMFSLLANYGLLVEMNRFQRHLGITKYSRIFRIALALLYFVLILTMISTVLLLYGTYNPKLIRYIIPQGVEHICFVLVLSFITYHTYRIKRLFENLNNFVLERVEEFNNRKLSIVSFESADEQYIYQDKYLAKLKEVTLNHNKLCDLVDKVNEAFKPCISMSMISIVATLLWSITMLIKYGIQGKVERTPSSRLIPFVTFFLIMGSIFVSNFSI